MVAVARSFPAGSHEVRQEVRGVHEGHGGGAPRRRDQAPQEDAQDVPPLDFAFAFTFRRRQQ